MIKKFEVGKSYGGRFVCNSDSGFSYKVIARTEKTVTIQEELGHNKFEGEIKKCRIKMFFDAESIYPMGRYSMCPVLHAE